MGSRKDSEGRELGTEHKKAEGLIKEHFGWDNDRRRLQEEENAEVGEVGEKDIRKIRRWVEQVLSGTSNASAPGSDGISYRFLKKIKGINLGRQLLEEVAGNIQKG